MLRDKRIVRAIEQPCFWWWWLRDSVYEAYERLHVMQDSSPNPVTTRVTCCRKGNSKSHRKDNKTKPIQKDNGFANFYLMRIIGG
jgi:hypothetical protein